jgi:hypothetical protein
MENDRLVLDGELGITREVETGYVRSLQLGIESNL